MREVTLKKDKHKKKGSTLHLIEEKEEIGLKRNEHKKIQRGSK
jgi:hypothetical protein